MKYLAIILVSLFTFSVQGQTLSYSNYRTPAQIDDALNTLHSNYPSLTKIETIGNSLNGTPIKALKIAQNPTVNDPLKGDVVFMSLIHAREWITVENLLYIADRMLDEYSTNSELKADIDAAQIWIIPIANPDGHAHTHSVPLPSDWLTKLNSPDPVVRQEIEEHPRFWRKNRRNNGDGTYGVDLNRNWGFQWGLSSGSSGTPSHDTYRGTAPFSEPENVVIRNFVATRNNLKTFVSYHSFSELYLRPWAYTTSDPPGETTLESIVKRNIDRIQSVHGHVYSETIGYTASGETTDYMWEEHRAAAFTPELRPTPTNLAGFNPPTTEILPSAQENYAAALALLHDASRTGLYIRDHGSDTGAEPSAVWTGSGWSAPFWVSPDIWTVPATLNQNATVDLNVRVNNNTGMAQNNVTLDVYYTDPRISLEFPNPNAILIGSKTITVPPGGKVETFSWTTPTGTNSWGELHWCVGAVVKHENDMPLTTQIQRSSNVSCRNFNTTSIVESLSLTIAAQNFLDVPVELIYDFDEQAISPGWEVELPDEIIRRTGQLSESTIRKSKLLKTKGFILEPGETIYLPVRVQVENQVPNGTSLDININGTLLPLVAGKREAVGNGFTYKVTKG